MMGIGSSRSHRHPVSTQSVLIQGSTGKKGTKNKQERVVTTSGDTELIETDMATITIKVSMKDIKNYSQGQLDEASFRERVSVLIQ